jgi:hypothetical protein
LPPAGRTPGSTSASTNEAEKLEIIAVEVQPADGGQHYLLVIHVMPTRFRGDSP